MPRLPRTLATLIGLVATFAPVPPAAHAAATHVAISGTGTINPGLPCPPSGCSIHLDFTAVFAGAANGIASCTLDGTDDFPGGATVLSGSGSGTVNCAGDVSANGTVAFSRTGAVVDVGGMLTVNGEPATVHVTLAFRPLTSPPFTTFAVEGGGTHGDAGVGEPGPIDPGPVNPPEVTVDPVDGPYGALCNMSATRAGSLVSARLDGGPLVLPDSAGSPSNPGSATLRCRVQANHPVHLAGEGPQVSGHGSGVVTVPATNVVLAAAPGDVLYLCAAVTYDAGPTFYYDARHDEWSTSSSVPCDDGTNPELDDEDIDPVLCPLLAALLGGDGDLPGVWNCPPYGGQQARAADSGGGTDDRRGAHKPKKPLTPTYPAGTIRISSTIPGQVSFDYSGFSPARGQWQCTEGLLTITCTPPPPASGFRNVCGAIDLSVLNQVEGSVTGNTTCANAPAATAMSVGPTTTPTTHTETPNTDFPLTCDAAAAQALPGPWEVVCMVRSS